VDFWTKSAGAFGSVGRVAFLDLDLDVAFKLGDFLVGVD
jgi:hypothetical protein